MERNLIPVLSLIIIALLVQGAAAATTQNQAASLNINAGILTLSIDPGASLAFNATLTGDDIVDLNPTTVPTIRVKNAKGNSTGWNVTLRCTNFTSGGKTIEVHNVGMDTGLYFEPSNVAITKVGGTGAKAGDPVAFTTAPGFMDLDVKCVSATVGRGQFVYTPALSDFKLDIPNDASAANYTGTLTATVTDGP